ncbi:PepSY-like domain-containing protein [Helicobacter sp. UBA3407]|uniref:PepSY-like domain-containing protein n=1 Tax=Helicobacter TaxID=209 RepID=UPI00260FCAA1|nr:PepSY-like domain-containing protein [Helicobacter sp. UBA3407]
MKFKLFIYIILNSVLLANPNIPIEETTNLPQSPATNQVTTTPTNSMPTQSAQPHIQENNTIQSAPTQPIQNMLYPNNNEMGYGASLQTIFAKVHQMYPSSHITDVDYKGFGYEIEINDSLELFFDRNGNLLGQKWD